ncbi:70 kDa peptidyl-prolyl isomerase-like isoform X4 [Salvia miltiorrhiza]|uniref:70 kDa peptidyl-prolyl isomerase-like isoform X4 n=1 Tax=Salvia miltiorrhiza TaxID=226208 RepID=UPI0025ABA8C2|nr:70 kDa peptidyl-prolyl isomerase-like isoform X4 [Salvia miltiorrhiza]
MVEFSKANIKDFAEDGDDEEEPGEEVESAPPLKVGQEREIGSKGLRKKLLKRGVNWESPQFGDEVTFHYVGTLCEDGSIFASTRTTNEPVTFKLGHDNIVKGLDHGIVTMRKGEIASFMLHPELAYGVSGTTGVPSNSIVQFEVELLSWITVVDICKDGGIIKKILETGEQIGPPGELDEVCGHFCPALTKALKTMKRGERANLIVQPKFRYTAMLEDGTVFERKGFDDEQPLQFITDEEQVVAGLDRAVSTMKKNECALITISPEYGVGSTEVKMDLSSVQPSSTILYEVEMLDFIREKAPWELSTPERIEAAVRRKEEGNQLFKIGKYQRAAKKYEKAVDYVSQDVPYTDDDEKIVKPLMLSCWSNGAACCLKLNNFREAIDLCSKILNAESCNVKALYRRAQAYMGVAELLLAELDIKKALEVDPQNREVWLMQKNLKQLQAQNNKQDAKLYRAMFSSKSEDACIAEKRLKTAKDDKDTSMLDESTAAMILETKKYSC